MYGIEPHGHKWPFSEMLYNWSTYQMNEITFRKVNGLKASNGDKVWRAELNYSPIGYGVTKSEARADAMDYLMKCAETIMNAGQIRQAVDGSIFHGRIIPDNFIIQTFREVDGKWLAQGSMIRNSADCPDAETALNEYTAQYDQCTAGVVA